MFPKVRILCILKAALFQNTKTHSSFSCFNNTNKIPVTNASKGSACFHGVHLFFSTIVNGF